MSYGDASPGSDRKRRKRCLLLGVAVVLLTVTVLALVLGLTLEKRTKNPEEQFKRTVVGRCETYLEQHNDISSLNDCERIWDTFHQAYVGKDPCDVPPEAYDPLIKSVIQPAACSRMLFWSKTKDMVHAFTDKRECLFTVEDTLLGFLFDGLTWCSKNNSKEIFTTDCPAWGDCENNPVRSFWMRASLNFATTACGNVSAMLNGSLESPFSSSSVFGSVEVKNLDPKKVNSLTVLLVTKETDPSTCASPSFQNLQSSLNPIIEYNCRQVPYNRLEGCISDPEIPCVDCL